MSALEVTFLVLIFTEMKMSVEWGGSAGRYRTQLFEGACLNSNRIRFFPSVFWSLKVTPLHLIVSWAIGCIMLYIAVFEAGCVERCTTSESGAVSGV